MFYVLLFIPLQLRCFLLFYLSCKDYLIHLFKDQAFVLQVFCSYILFHSLMPFLCTLSPISFIFLEPQNEIC